MLLIVKTLDIFLGVPGIHLYKDIRRKHRYGKAGAFRVKRYGEFDGVEYRVLSNFWVKSEEFRKWAFNSIQKAVTFLNRQDDDPVRHVTKQEPNVIHAINSNDTELLSYFISRFPILLANENNEVLL